MILWNAILLSKHKIPFFFTLKHDRIYKYDTDTQVDICHIEAITHGRIYTTATHVDNDVGIYTAATQVDTSHVEMGEAYVWGFG